MKSGLSKQHGMTTLVISTILVFAASLVGLYSSRSILLEQKISHNNTVSHQLFYQSNTLLNQNTATGTKNLFNSQIKEITAVANNSNTFTKTTASHQLGSAPIAGNGFGKIIPFPLITRLGIALTENLLVENISTKSTIWSGADVLLKNTPSLATLNLSAQIIDNDFNLYNLTQNQFFANFLNESPEFIKQLSIENSLYFPAALAQETNLKQGLIWLGDGNKNITLDNATIGTQEKPVVMIVDTQNSVFSTRGTILLYGLLYIRGDWHPTGEITVYGGIVVEGQMLATENEEWVNTHIIYQPEMLKPKQAMANTSAKIMGTWTSYNE